MTPVSTKGWGISLPAQQLSTSQEGMCPFELLSTQAMEFHCPKTKSLSILQDYSNSISHLGLFTVLIVYCFVPKNSKTLQE